MTTNAELLKEFNATLSKVDKSISGYPLSRYTKVELAKLLTCMTDIIMDYEAQLYAKEEIIKNLQRPTNETSAAKPSATIYLGETMSSLMEQVAEANRKLAGLLDFRTEQTTLCVCSTNTLWGPRDVQKAMQSLEFKIHVRKEDMHTLFENFIKQGVRHSDIIESELPDPGTYIIVIPPDVRPVEFLGLYVEVKP